MTTLRFAAALFLVSALAACDGGAARPSANHFGAAPDSGTVSATVQVDPFAGEPEIKNQPGTAAFVITPSDSAALASQTRWLYVGVSGDVTADFINGGVYVTLKAMPIGLYQLGVSKIYATSTTATNLVGLQ